MGRSRRSRERTVRETGPGFRLEWQEVAGRCVGLLTVPEVAQWICQKGVTAPKDPNDLSIWCWFTSWTQRLDATHLSDLTIAKRKCLLTSCSGWIPKHLE